MSSRSEAQATPVIHSFCEETRVVQRPVSGSSSSIVNEGDSPAAFAKTVARRLSCGDHIGRMYKEASLRSSEYALPSVARLTSPWLPDNVSEYCPAGEGMALPNGWGIPPAM